jgi:excinuclease UvrABC helicase subunit UvrB
VEREDFAAAVRVIEHGMAKIRAFYEDETTPEAVDASPELAFLQEWLEEVRAKQPVTKLEKMKIEMDKAIQAEAYERAAELRDQIQRYMQKRGRSPSS